MADSITVPMAYLETLLRRADFHDSESSVKVSAAHYNALVKDAYRLQCLTAALIAGGASWETLEVLITSQQNHSTISTTSAHRLDWSEETDEEESSTDIGIPRFDISRCNQRQYFQSTNPSTPTSTVHRGDGLGPNQFSEKARCHVSTHGHRSLVLRNIPPSTSISDLTNVIRGGKILNMYIRRSENTAHVSFVLPEAAKSFHSFSCHHQIAVKDKPVQIAWDRQQAYLPGYLANQILHSGATRNLVIRFVKPDMSAASIREDLEHIYRLEVAHIEFKEGHAWIQLNSIQHAVTAKTCMQSRQKYKKLRIEYFPDGCDSPISFMDASKKQRQPPIAVPEVSTKSSTNRFATLSIDSYGDDSESGTEGM